MFIQILTLLVLYMTLDILWFSISVPFLYLPKFTEIQGSAPNFLLKMHGGLMAWFLLALGMYVFVMPKITSLWDAIYYGFIYGLVVYGVYNGTNYVTLTKYDSKIFFADLMWGCLVSSVVAVLMYKINTSFKLV